MGLPNSDNEVVEMTPDLACDYARKIVDEERKSAGGLDRALDQLARRTGITRWQWSHLRKGNAKTIDASLYQRVRRAYQDSCERQIRLLKHELEMDRHMHDDANQDLAAEAEALLAKLRARKAVKA